MDDMTYALACALALNPQYEQQIKDLGREITAPRHIQTHTQSLWTGGGVDSSGNTYDSHPAAVAKYRHGGGFGPGAGLMTLPKNPGKPELAHEQTHRLQDLAGVDPGANPNSDARRAIEAQAYVAQERATYECLTFFGGWDKEALAPYMTAIEKD